MQENHVNILSKILDPDESLVPVIVMAESDNAIMKLCESEQLNDFWGDLLSKPEILARKFEMPKNEPLPQYMPQPNISNFKLILGAYYFDKAANCDGLQQTLFLEKAEKYGFCAAFLVLQTKLLNEVIHAIENKNELPKEFDLKATIKRYENAAQLHGTPCYISLAYFCLKMAKYHKHVLKSENEIISSCYQLVITYFEAARLLEPCCTASINNAYLGEGIKTSNSFQCNNIESICNWAIGIAGYFLNKDIIAIAKSQAARIAEVHKRDEVTWLSITPSSAYGQW